MNSFYLNFFIFSKKKLLRNIRSCSEYLTLFTVYRMFALRNLMSTIMKARVYRLYKILTWWRDDSSSWPKGTFCKRYIVSLCPGVSLFPRLRYVSNQLSFTRFSPKTIGSCIICCACDFTMSLIFPYFVWRILFALRALFCKWQSFNRCTDTRNSHCFKCENFVTFVIVALLSCFGASESLLSSL